jgi:hypothetical protein
MILLLFLEMKITNLVLLLERLWVLHFKRMKYKNKKWCTGGTAHNRSVYASPPVGGLGSEKPQSALRAFVGVFLRHILARRKPAVCFIGGPKRHIQPERYATLGQKCIKNRRKYD